MALTALVSRGLDDRQARWWLVGLGIFGAAMFYGDGMITPAISVLSAVEGLEVVAPALQELRHPGDARDPARAVLDPAPRDGEGRRVVRPADVRLVRDARRAGRGRDLAATRGC